MQKNEKIGISLALLGFAFIAGILMLASNMGTKAHASGQIISQCFDSTLSLATTSPGYNSGCVASATTSPLYLTTSATTTLMTAYVPIASAADLNLDAVASSTASVILYTVQFSNDNVNWYGQTFASASGAVNTVSTGFNSWTPGTTATTTVNVHLGLIGSKYIRVVASAAAAAASVYAQLIPLNTIPN